MRTELLEKLGMNSKQVKLYLLLLELGSVGVNVLAKMAEENRTSVYSTLNSMMKKGFVGFKTKRGVKSYFATNPSVLISSYVQIGGLLKEFLPELMAIQNNHKQKPKITFYEGLGGIKQIAEMLLEVPNSVRESFMGFEESEVHLEMQRYIEEGFLKRRIDSGIFYRGIVNKYVPMSRNHEHTEKAHLRELRYVDPDEFPLSI